MKRVVATRRKLSGKLGIGLDDIPATSGCPAHSVRYYFTNISVRVRRGGELAADRRPTAS